MSKKCDRTPPWTWKNQQNFRIDIGRALTWAWFHLGERRRNDRKVIKRAWSEYCDLVDRVAELEARESP